MFAIVPKKDITIVGIVFDNDTTPIATGFTNMFVINKSSPDDSIELNFDIEFHIPDFISSFYFSKSKLFLLNSSSGISFFFCILYV